MKKNKQNTPETENNEGVNESIIIEEEMDETFSEPEMEETGPDELEQLKDTHLRLMAEYDNYRKRTAKERDGLYALAKASVVEQLLPVYDNIERATNQPSSDEAYKKGVDMIMQQLTEVFGRIGVSEIEAAGKEFDPEMHNAVMHIEDENIEKSVVVEVFQKGFIVDGKVIRHAVVKVAN